MDAHQVPGVEVLVRDLSEQRPGIASEVRARRAERDRAAVFERAVGTILQEKRIVAIRRAPEQRPPGGRAARYCPRAPSYRTAPRRGAANTRRGAVRRPLRSASRGAAPPAGASPPGR